MHANTSVICNTKTGMSHHLKLEGSFNALNQLETCMTLHGNNAAVDASISGSAS
jgi:hypothetical protein